MVRLEQRVAHVHAAVEKVDGLRHRVAGQLGGHARARVELARPGQVGVAAQRVRAQARGAMRKTRALAGLDVFQFVLVAVVARPAQVTLRRQRVARNRLPVQARRQLQRIAGLVIGVGGMAQQDGAAALVGGGAAVGAVVALGGGDQRVAHRAGFARTLGRQTGRHAAGIRGRAGLDLGLRGARLAALAQDDVDGAGDRLAARLGGGRAQDLDALDQFGIDRLKRKPGRRRQAVQEDGHVAAAETAHADGRLAGRAVDGDARLAFEDVDEAVVALAHDLVAGDDDGGGRRLRARVDGAGVDPHLLDRLLDRLRLRARARVDGQERDGEQRDGEERRGQGCAWCRHGVEV